jgi:hypothetical protein
LKGAAQIIVAQILQEIVKSRRERLTHRTGREKRELKSNKFSDDNETQKETRNKERIHKEHTKYTKIETDRKRKGLYSKI